MDESNYKISRNVAVWLIKVCTRIIRDATKTRWSPLQVDLMRYAPGNFLDKTKEMGLGLRFDSWMEAMVSVCQIIASSLAFQTSPEIMSETLSQLTFPDEIDEMPNIPENYLND